MKIGELAESASCPVQTIRFFEAEGLLQPPNRSANNYRDYGQAHADRLAFILRCRSLDMAHDDIRTLLRYQDEPGTPCDVVNALLDGHVRRVARRIAELRELQRQFQDIRRACADGSSLGEGGALDALRQSTGASPKKGVTSKGNCR